MLWYDGLFDEMERASDEERGRRMSAYMRDRFDFLGIPQPNLNPIIKPYLKESRKLPFDWDFVFTCWGKPYREAQYVAVSYIRLHKQEFQKTDIENLKKLIKDKSWWDTVDMLDSICGILVTKNPELKTMMLEWSMSDDIWLRRVAIDFQNRYKDLTDTKLLEKIIVNNFGSTEFFINKAIGWSLREYAKTNADWVRRFLIKHKTKLAPLSIREASKYL